MSFNSWLQGLKSTCGFSSSRRVLSRPPQRRPRPALPRVLQLETRLTPRAYPDNPWQAITPGRS
jgi:hypothetical protein